MTLSRSIGTMTNPRSIGSFIQELLDRDPRHRATTLKSRSHRAPPTVPALSKSQINYVLGYPGSFNPPHRAHMYLFKHVFIHGCHGLNFVAAIVAPCSDTALRDKVNRKQLACAFGNRERCQLWSQDHEFPRWAWVFERSSIDMDLPSFLTSLKETCAYEGYPVKFMRLNGADCSGPYNPPDAGPLYDVVILSDAARRADYRSGSRDRIRDFHYGCTRWRQSSVIASGEELKRHIKMKAEAWYPEALSMNENEYIGQGMFSNISHTFSFSLRLKYHAQMPCLWMT